MLSRKNYSKSMSQKYFHLVFLFACFPLLLSAQHYNLQKFKEKDNLAGLTINDIIKDHQNKIWIATQEGGVSIFNGREFTNYSTKEGLISNDTKTLCEDDQGNIWIGTIRGLSVFDGKKMNHIKAYGLDTVEIRSIFKDTKNNLYFATMGNGWIKYDGKKYLQYTTKNGLPTDYILCTSEDKSGNLWLGTYHEGVCKINPQSITTNTVTYKQFKDQIHLVTRIKNGIHHVKILFLGRTSKRRVF